ncbi:ABC transporter substrate-binding protein [Pseudonocardia sp. HH130630-07]|uniref:ABC transporter substrate-binding protein n=1 Tax=Pseudonocardia sp. HH130630-07 TaxID=1690815 RepID=UPI0008152FEA|nr:ABC transporter substrate-binding protein [Pseudonocardia sp. HH130630-07]ANY08342.1 LacI family transcriptional regulator [Pseudonocardia sp. HH130630-07]
MRTRRLLVATVAALSLALAGCGSGARSGDDEPLEIAIVSKGFQHEFWQAVKQGADQEAARQQVNITFEGPATESEIEAQVTMLTNAVGRGPDALAVAALDSRAAAPVLQQAQGSGIPVVAFDSGVESDIPVTTAATDNRAAAAEAAKQLSTALGGVGKVGVVVHDQTSRSGIDRRDGFVEWMRANAPGIQLLDPQYGGGDQAKSADIAKAIVAANPDLRGIYGSNEGTAIGVTRGVGESGRQGVAIAGFDSGSGQTDAIRDGRQLGAVTQDPVRMGAEVVKAAVKAVNGEEQPKVINTGFYWYDRSNINDPRIQSSLYE